MIFFLALPPLLLAPLIRGFPTTNDFASFKISSSQGFTMNQGNFTDQQNTIFGPKQPLQEYYTTYLEDGSAQASTWVFSGYSKPYADRTKSLEIVSKCKSDLASSADYPGRTDKSLLPEYSCKIGGAVVVRVAPAGAASHITVQTASTSLEAIASYISRWRFTPESADIAIYKGHGMTGERIAWGGIYLNIPKSS